MQPSNRPQHQAVQVPQPLIDAILSAANQALPSFPGITLQQALNAAQHSAFNQQQPTQPPAQGA